VTAALFLFPAVFAFIMAIIIPFFLGIYYSLTDWKGFAENVNYIGFSNFTKSFASDEFRYSFLVTTIFTAINVVLVNAVAFGLSLLVTSELRLRNFYRTGFFVPNLIGGIVLGYIWQFLFNNVFTKLGSDLGLGFLSKSMLTNPYWAVLAVSWVSTWQYAGYIMMIYVAAIQGIPASLLEAANVDGATYMTKLRRILIPMVANAFTISLFLTLVNSFKLFDVNLSLTNGGPAMVMGMTAVKSTQFLALNIYNTAFNMNQMAQGQARSVLFFIVLVIISLAQVAVSKRREVEM
jgi:raffinose/stachyose/melibiose transport system permease protein